MPEIFSFLNSEFGLLLVICLVAAFVIAILKASLEILQSPIFWVGAVGILVLVPILLGDSLYRTPPFRIFECVNSDSDFVERGIASCTISEIERFFGPIIEKGEENIYVFQGEVNEKSVKRAIAALLDGANVLQLDSIGGELVAGIILGDIVSEGRIDTVVSGNCFSACALIFIGGCERQVSPGGRLGVHQWKSARGRPSERETQDLAGRIADFISKQGVSTEFFVKGSITPPEGMYVLSRPEMADWGVIRSRNDCASAG